MHIDWFLVLASVISTIIGAIISSVITSIKERKIVERLASKRLFELEEEVRALREQLGMAPPETFAQMNPEAAQIPTGPMSEIESEIRQGKKINAIKIYREQTGVGLKEAKDAVEEMELRMKYGV